jgi:cell division protein FtsI/penicillin-binding protein 2
LEATLDPYLRGLQGNPASSIWWNHLVYGQPPPGLDVRLSIDLDLQQRADSLLANRSGAVVLLNAESGEILAIASHPTFNPNLLDQQAAALLKDPQSPLLDRAAQELYPPGPGMQAWLQVNGLSTSSYAALGFYTTPDLHLPVAPAVSPGQTLRISPLQMALAASALSYNGLRPAARLAMAVKTPSQGWVVLPPLSQPVQVLSAQSAATATQSLMVKGQPFWQWSGLAGPADKTVSWALAGTLPSWQGIPMAVLVLLEGNDRSWAATIGQQLLAAAMQP